MESKRVWVGNFLCYTFALPSLLSNVLISVTDKDNFVAHLLKSTLNRTYAIMRNFR